MDWYDFEQICKLLMVFFKQLGTIAVITANRYYELFSYVMIRPFSSRTV